VTIDEAMDAMFTEVIPLYGLVDEWEYLALDDFVADLDLTDDDLITMAVIEAGLD